MLCTHIEGNLNDPSFERRFAGVWAGRSQPTRFYSTGTNAADA